jgi:subtilisin family serine protease
MTRSRAVVGSRALAYALVAILALLLTVPAGSAPINAPIVKVRSPMTGQMVDAFQGHILLLPRPGVTPAQMDALNRQMGAVSARPLAHGMVYAVELRPTVNMATAMNRYLRSPLIKAAEPNGPVIPYGSPVKPARVPKDGPKAVPNDPYWSQQWGPQIIECEAAWDFEKGDPSIVIAVLDTGTDYTHEDLTNHMYRNPDEIPGNGIDDDGNGYIDDVYGWDFYDNDADPAPDMSTGDPSQGHGTHVSGTAAADTDNGIGVAGVAWNGSLMAVRVLGPAAGSWDIIIEGITYAADNGARVINMSLGPAMPYFLDTMQPPIDYAYSRGVVVVCAEGNSYYEITTDRSTWFSPVCNDGLDPSVDNHVLGVMATDSSDIKADFSNYGDAYKLCDVCAPGVDIWSTFPGNGYEGPPTWSGTSMASPHGAGLAALVLAQTGTTDAGAVIEQIRATAVNIDSVNPGYGGKLGTGRISAAAAVGLDLPPGPASAVNAFDTPGDNGGSITITWKRSPDDGAGHNDVIGYEVWRGDTNDPATGNFAIVPGGAVPPGTASFRDQDPNLINGHAYYYYIMTKDKSSAVRSTNVAGPAVPRDDLAPAPITDLIARDHPADDGRAIDVIWTGYEVTPDLAGFRVYRALEAFTDVSDTSVVTLIKQIDDPSATSYFDNKENTDRSIGAPIDQTDYWYAVTTFDAVGNEIKVVEAAGPVRSAPNLNISFSSGLRLITLPAQPIDPTPMAVFNITDPAAISLARWDPLTGAYHALADNPDDPVLQMGPGLGFWLDRSITSYISTGGTLVKKPTYDVPIAYGWNMVGCPYNTDYPFKAIDVRDAFGTREHITASDRVRKYGWRYDAAGRTYRLVSPLLPGGDETLPAREAMWIYSFEPSLSLVFENLTSAAQVAEEQPAALDGWQVKLSARIAGAADTDNIIGVTPRAGSLGKIVGPPPLKAGVDLYLISGRRSADRLAVDLRKSLAAGATWNVAVECQRPSAKVTISWPDLSRVPGNLRPILTDLATGQAVYMRTAGGYTYESRKAGETRRFTLRFDAATRGPLLTQVAAQPIRAGGAEVLYTLARPVTKVRVEILNLAGRRVATVGPLEGTVGLNRTAWSGASSTGERVPNGRYVVRVTATAGDNGETATALVPVTIGR